MNDKDEILKAIEEGISANMNNIREDIKKSGEEVSAKLADFDSKISALKSDYEALKDVRVSSPGRIWLLFEYRNALIESRVYLSAMIDYALRKGGSRGSAIYSDEKGSVQPEALDERFRFSLENEDSPDIQEIKLDGNSVSITYRQPRPIPQDDGFFENVWARYRKDGCVY